MQQNQVLSYPQGVVIIMSDTAILASFARSALLDIAKQANALGVGLQNAAPGGQAGAPNNSVQYLLDVASMLTAKAEEFKGITETEMK